MKWLRFILKRLSDNGDIAVSVFCFNSNQSLTCKLLHNPPGSQFASDAGEFGEEGTSMTFEKGVATFKLKDGDLVKVVER